MDGNNFINSYKLETTEVSGTKTWNDAENQDGKRPESIIVRLLANGKQMRLAAGPTGLQTCRNMKQEKKLFTP